MDLNHRHADYRSAALPLSYPGKLEPSVRVTTSGFDSPRKNLIPLGTNFIIPPLLLAVKQNMERAAESTTALPNNQMVGPIQAAVFRASQSDRISGVRRSTTLVAGVGFEPTTFAL